MHSDKTLLYTTQYFSNKPRFNFASLKSNSKFKKSLTFLKGISAGHSKTCRKTLFKNCNIAVNFAKPGFLEFK